jgi:hypothetical protein
VAYDRVERRRLDRAEIETSFCLCSTHSKSPSCRCAIGWDPTQGTAPTTRWFTEILAEVVGHPVPEPVATAVTAWAHDPFTGGAYSTGLRAAGRLGATD